MERFLNREEIRELLKKELEDRPLIDCVKERLVSIVQISYPALDSNTTAYMTVAESFAEILDLINIYESNAEKESSECSSHGKD